MAVLPSPPDAVRVSRFLADHPPWSAYWDKKYGLWRVAEADDWQEFEPVLEKATAKRVFVVAIVGAGRKHDATVTAYPGAVTDPGEIALDLITLVS